MNNTNQRLETKVELQQTLRGYAIVVVKHGFVYVGKTEVDESWCVLQDARNIRVWGTKNGLGELVLNGPQPNTKLDPCGKIRIPIHALITVMDTDERLWKT